MLQGISSRNTIHQRQDPLLPPLRSLECVYAGAVHEVALQACARKGGRQLASRLPAASWNRSSAWGSGKAPSPDPFTNTASSAFRLESKLSGCLRSYLVSTALSHILICVDLSGTFQDCGGQGLELVWSILTNIGLLSTPEKPLFSSFIEILVWNTSPTSNDFIWP